jgi:hypothetical protein
MTWMAARPTRPCGSGFEGAAYEIALSSSNARAFRAQLAPFIEHARKAGRAGRQRSSDIRAWAKDHGIAVSNRGRIPASVAEQYHAAGQGR